MAPKPSQFAIGYQQALSDTLDAIDRETTTTDRLVAALRYIADNATDTGTRDEARRMENAEDMGAAVSRMTASEARVALLDTPEDPALARERARTIALVADLIGGQDTLLGRLVGGYVREAAK